MNIRFHAVLLFAALICLVLKGSSDQLNLEDAAITLAGGMDLDQNEKFRIYSNIPVFSRDVKKKTHVVDVRPLSYRASRSIQDAESAGSIQGRNIQVVLVGRRLLQHKNWFPMMDIMFRDARNTVTFRMIAVDGPVAEFINFYPEDQPLLPVLLREIVDTKSASAETVKTTEQELHRQFFEKGITPAMSEMKLQNKTIILVGTALLHKDGTYAASLTSQESILLNILKNNARSGASLSYPIPGEPKSGPFRTDTMSFSADKIKTKIATSYREGRFHFDMKVILGVQLTEHLFPYDVTKSVEELERKASREMQAQFESLIAKIQRYHLDPIGLGLYARAFEFKKYKQVQDHWADELADAEIKVSIDLKIKAMGPVK